MEPHQQRVVIEKQELDERRHKLSHFIAEHQYLQLPEEDRELLMNQLFAMNLYASILKMRIKRFAT